MEELIKLQKKIIPEMVQLIEKRYTILRSIYYNQPIGRRILANKLQIGERIVRNEIDFLKEQQLIEVNSQGMNVTEAGEEILNKLKDFVHEIRGLSEIEDVLKNILGLDKVIVVPGDVEKDHSVMNELGKSGANYLKKILRDEIIISLTGGTSVKSIVDNVSKNNKSQHVLVLPARGGMGKNVTTQSNVLAAELAQKLHANYKLLHVPDNLSDNALNTILQEKEIKELVEKIHASDIIILGIGKAEEMAVKRGMSPEELQKLREKEAVAEAFGYYFDQNGKIVYFSPTIGITRQDITNNCKVIAAAGGSSKAKAILAAELNMKTGVLITDESAARKIIELIKANSK